MRLLLLLSSNRPNTCAIPIIWLQPYICANVRACYASSATICNIYIHYMYYNVPFVILFRPHSIFAFWFFFLSLFCYVHSHRQNVHVLLTNDDATLTENALPWHTEEKLFAFADIAFWEFFPFSFSLSLCLSFNLYLSRPCSISCIIPCRFKKLSLSLYNFVYFQIFVDVSANMTLCARKHRDAA